MTGPTRKAIKKLGATLADYGWLLHSGAIRCAVIKATERHRELRLCPLAVAVTQAPDAVKRLLEDPNHEQFAETVKRRQPDMLEHLHEETADIDPANSEQLATLYAAAAVIHKNGGGAEAAAILDIDLAVAEHLATATDNPNCNTGRALVRNLDSPQNLLRNEYEACYGRLGDAGS